MKKLMLKEIQTHGTNEMFFFFNIMANIQIQLREAKNK